MHRPRIVLLWGLLSGAVAWGGALACDAGRRQREGLYSSNPLDRAQAVVRVAERQDAGAVHKLVDLLEDADPGVRMYAIQALRRLCGVDYGYRYYAAAAERAAAVERWRAALRVGEVKAGGGGAEVRGGEAGGAEAEGVAAAAGVGGRR